MGKRAKVFIPVMAVYKADGSTRAFKFPPKRKRAEETEIVIIHTRGGKRLRQPDTIKEDRIYFRKPPQKGNKILVIYNSEIK